jgi:SSS family solute:Na+ symporter
VINLQALTVFIAIFVVITILGFWAVRWHTGDLNRLQEWGLAGRHFGTFISWFLLGADIQTAYVVMSAPALILATGASGFFIAPTQVVQFIIFFLFMPRLWTVARHRGYITSADFVRERFGSGSLALLVAITGILATMPYIALQIYGIEICLTLLGIPVEIALLVAFVILAAYTYVSGLRAPAMIGVVRDLFIWIVVLATFIYLPAKLGGFTHIFAVVPQTKLILQPTQYTSYVSLILGTAVALFLYPHTLTGVFSTNSSKVIKRNAALLPAYSVLFVLIGLLGYVALAAGIKSSPQFGTNGTIPLLLLKMFPSWFGGFALATLVICALVPSAIMSIGAANLFTRNIYREYIRPRCTTREEADAAKVFSLIVKFGALAFILFLPTTFSINFQLLSNIWILQTFPAVFVGLYTNWLHRRALIIGWAAGMFVGTWLPFLQHFTSSVYPLSFIGSTIPVYAAIPATLANLLLTVAFTFVFRAIGVTDGRDATALADFKTHPVQDSQPMIQRVLPNAPLLEKGAYSVGAREAR